MKTTKTSFLGLVLCLALAAGSALAAPTVTASTATVTTGPVHIYPVPPGPAGEIVVAFVSTQSRVGNKDAEAANPGWESTTTGIAPFALLRLVKASDGSETSITINKAGDGAAIVLRVSGATVVKQHRVAVDYRSLLSDPPTATTNTSAKNVLVIALTANGVGVAMIPAGYGFPVTAAGPIDLTASFRTLYASDENPGPYSLNSGSDSTAASTLIY